MQDLLGSLNLTNQGSRLTLPCVTILVFFDPNVQKNNRKGATTLDRAACDICQKVDFTFAVWNPDFDAHPFLEDSQTLPYTLRCKVQDSLIEVKHAISQV